MKKVDKESTFRKLTGYSSRIVYIIAVGFHVFSSTQPFSVPWLLSCSDPIHLSFAFVLVFLLYPFRTKSVSNKLRWHDLLFAAFAGLVGLY